MFRFVVALCFVFTAVLPAEAQFFQDLDFEQAQLVSTKKQPEAGYPPASPVLASDALPGWTAQIGSTPVSVIGGGEAIVLDQTQILMAAGSEGSLQGAFSVELYGVFVYSGEIPPSSSIPQTASIFQSGIIPANAHSIQFLVGQASYAWNIGNTPYLYLDGNLIHPVAISTAYGVTTYAADVSSYAGTLTTVGFAAIPSVDFGGSPSNIADEEDDFILDGISFSTDLAPTPEPTSGLLVLVSFGALFLIHLQRSRYRQS